MRRSELDFILSKMLESQQEVSDLNFTVDKPLQVESFGELVPVPLDPPLERLTPFQTEMIALNLIGGNRRLTEDLLRTGSCDASYTLSNKARFRVNVFSQRANYSIVLRKLNTQIPTMEDLCMPEIFQEVPKEKTGILLVTGAPGSGKTTHLATWSWPRCTQSMPARPSTVSWACLKPRNRNKSASGWPTRCAGSSVSGWPRGWAADARRCWRLWVPISAPKRAFSLEKAKAKR